MIIKVLNISETSKCQVSNLIEAHKTKFNLPCSERVCCHKFQQEV